MSQNFREGNVPTAGDTERILLVKILNALNSSGGFSGVGTPEGNVTAQPGSTYVDTASGAFYVKRTTSGNTGWVQKVA